MNEKPRRDPGESKWMNTKKNDLPRSAEGHEGKESFAVFVVRFHRKKAVKVITL
jgi:hypothetical protein